MARWLAPYLYRLADERGNGAGETPDRDEVVVRLQEEEEEEEEEDTTNKVARGKLILGCECDR
ncbi:hypothetical protein L249_3221 [Ophiocordyceps polyrhachis-furcata BCC 54312]|uniref:Uncharacterized protein n=1 Tax=Ophiocordyceps polyrhachis-furcata BCC 54312 TaxID=1330021 RepID=A0A367LPR2_9HYPO|nr:hypothetical protein L249_3221 [Ophiocordyceps polyrhachis-furcata BCC 54312]